MKALPLLAAAVLAGCSHPLPPILRKPPEPQPPSVSEDLRARRLSALRLGPLMAGLSTAPASALLSESDAGLYTQRSVRLSDLSLGSIDATVLVPKSSGRHPAIVGAFECAGPCPADPALRPGADLARRSYVVVSALSHDDWARDPAFCRGLADRGLSLDSLRVYELLALSAFARSLPEVDDLRLGLATRGPDETAGLIASYLDPWVSARSIDIPPGLPPASAASPCAGLSPEALSVLDQLRGDPNLPSRTVSYTSSDPAADEQTAAYFSSVFSTRSFAADAAQASRALAQGQPALARRLVDPYSVQSGLPLEEQKRLVLVYAAVKDYPAAGGLAEQLAKSSPSDAGLWLLAARVAQGASERKQAMEDLQRAVELKPAGAQLREAALIYQDLKEYPSALRLFEQAAAAAPSASGPLEDLGVCEFMQGSAEKAAADLQKALSLEPGRLSAALSLGSVYLAAHKEAEAVKVYDAALALPATPQNQALRDAVAKARQGLAR